MAQKTELIARREEFDEIFDEFRQKYGDEFNLIILEQDRVRKIDNLKEERVKLARTLNKLENDAAMNNKHLSDKRRAIIELEEAIKESESQKEGKLGINQTEIEKLETYLRLKVDELDCPSFDDFIMEDAENRHLGIDYKILNRQIELVEEEERHLLDEWAIRETVLCDSINNLKCDLKLLMDDQDISDAAKKANSDLKVRQIEKYTNKLESEFSTHKDTIRALTDWKNGIRLKIKAHTRRGISLVDREEFDPNIAAERADGLVSRILREVLPLMSDSGEQQTFESMLKMYSDHLREREMAIQDIEHQIYKSTQGIKTLQYEIKGYSDTKHMLENDKEALKEHICKVANQEKIVDTDYQHKIAEAQQRVDEDIAEQFEDYLKKYQDVFTDVKKTYGMKVLKRMREDHRAEFDELSKAQRYKRRAKLENLYGQISYLEDCIKTNDDYVQSFTIPKVAKLNDLYKMEFQRTDDLEKQIQALGQAQEELQEQIGNILSNKKENLWSSLHDLYKNKNYEEMEEHLSDIERNIEFKSREIEELEKEIEVHKKSSEQILGHMTRELGDLNQSKRRNTGDITKIVQSENKPKLDNLEQRLLEIDGHFKDSYRAMEVFEERYRLAKEGYELARNALLHRLENEDAQRECMQRVKEDVEDVVRDLDDLLSEVPQIEEHLEVKERLLQSPEKQLTGDDELREAKEYIRTNILKKNPVKVHQTNLAKAKSSRIMINGMDQSPTKTNNTFARNTVQFTSEGDDFLQSEGNQLSEAVMPSSSGTKMTAFNSPKVLYQGGVAATTPARSTTSLTQSLAGVVTPNVKRKNIVKLKAQVSFNYDGCSEEERKFLDTVEPLLMGGEIYKKFSSHTNHKHANFDPLNAENVPAENCGYGIRNFKLSKSLHRIEVRQTVKPGVESSIVIEHIFKVIIPKTTLDIIKFQNLHDQDHLSHGKLSVQEREEKSSDLLKSFAFKSGGSSTKKQIVKLETKLMTCTHFPFFVALDQGGRIELVADGYETFKQWTSGINSLIKFKKQLDHLKFRVTAEVKDQEDQE